MKDDFFMIPITWERSTLSWSGSFSDPSGTSLQEHTDVQSYTGLSDRETGRTRSFNVG